MDARRPTRRVLEHPGATRRRVHQLAWSPDGTRIAHTAGEQIFVDDLSSGRWTRLATGLSQGYRYGSVAWSPRGERIAFVVGKPFEKEFWVISGFLPKQ